MSVQSSLPTEQGVLCLHIALIRVAVAVRSKEAGLPGLRKSTDRVGLKSLPLSEAEGLASNPW